MPANAIRVMLFCGLALCLGGCVAVPVAQMAATQMVAAKPAVSQVGLPASVPGVNGQSDFTAGFGDALHKLTSLASQSQPETAPASPAK